MDDVRLLLTDESWETLGTIISGVKSAAGAPPEISDRLFVEAVLYRARVGCPWRDLPKCFGAWDAIYNRFRRWVEIGVWKALCERLPEDGLAAVKALFIDSTVVRAHQHAAGAAAKKGGKKPKVSVAVAAVSAPKSTSRQQTRTRLLASW
jgi:transposase